MAGHQHGTNHFVSKAAADRYYQAMGYDSADGQIADGSIVIGPPALKESEELRIDHSEGRYVVRVLDQVAPVAVQTDASLTGEAALLSVSDNRVILPTQHLKHYADLKRLLETSGGKYNSKGYFSFPDGVDAEEVLAAVRQGKAQNGKKASQSFFTPEDLAYEVCQAAGFLEGKRVLEPSAGDGALADIARAAGAKVVVVENHRPNVLALEKKGYSVWDRDFLSLTPDDLGLFDAILANPPFSNNQDIEHVLHMFKFLKPGGTLSVITSQRWKTGSQKAHAEFREFLDAQGAVVTEIEGGAFRESGTLVPTLRIRLVKKAAPAVLELVPEQPSFFPERKKPQRPERPQADLAQKCLAI